MTEKDGNLGAPERVALCLRVSSEEQRERETIEIQEEFLSQYCRLYGLDVAGTYKDDGVSGTIPLQERPEGRRLLEDAQAGSTRCWSTSWIGWEGRSWSSWTLTTASRPRASP